MDPDQQGGRVWPIRLVPSLAGTRPNHWLNAVLLGSQAERSALLEASNGQGAMTRPIWRLMNRLPKYVDRQHDGLEDFIWLEERVVNLPGRLKLEIAVRATAGAVGEAGFGGWDGEG